VDFMGSNIKGEIFFKDLTCFVVFFFFNNVKRIRDG